MTHLISSFVTAASSQALRAAPIVANVFLSTAPMGAVAITTKEEDEGIFPILGIIAIARLAFMGVAAYFNIATGSGLGAGLSFVATIALVCVARENGKVDKFMDEHNNLMLPAMFVIGFAAGDACELGARSAFARLV